MKWDVEERGGPRRDTGVGQSWNKEGHKWGREADGPATSCVGLAPKRDVSLWLSPPTPFPRPFFLNLPFPATPESFPLPFQRPKMRDQIKILTALPPPRSPLPKKSLPCLQPSSASPCLCSPLPALSPSMAFWVGGASKSGYRGISHPWGA